MAIFIAQDGKGEYFSYFSMKIYVVGTHSKCLEKALLMCTHYMFPWRNKINISTFWMKNVPYLDLCFFFFFFLGGGGV